MKMHRPVRMSERLFGGLCLVAIALPLLLLALLLVDVTSRGLAALDWDFITGYPSRRASRAGIMPALVGSTGLLALTGLFALPVGVGAAIYLEEYSKQSRMARFIELNIANLAGVPSVIYGLLGLGLFVRFAGLGRSLLAGSFTLGLLVLPVVIIASREALRTVPWALREASLALGATRLQTIRMVVLPAALPGIMTGSILALSRAVGETAPLIVVGALTFITFLPTDPSSPFTALPIQIFNWVSRPQPEFVTNAAAGIVVLLGVMLTMSSIAIYLRNKFQYRGV